MDKQRVGVAQSRPVGTNKPAGSSYDPYTRILLSERRYLMALAKQLQEQRANVIQRLRDLENELGIDRTE